MKKIKRYYIFVPLLILLTTSCLGLYVYKWEYRKLFLEIYFFSLERGRAIFIRTPQNKTILIGGGQNSEVIRGITKVLPFYSRKIDLVIAPAATPAQIGGLIEVIERYEIDEIVFPKIMSTSTVFTQLTREIKKRKRVPNHYHDCCISNHLSYIFE